MHTAMARLAQVYGVAVAATFFAWHEVVAGGLLHGALAEAAARFEGTLGASSSLGGGLSELLATGHGTNGISKIPVACITPIGRQKLRNSDLRPYIDPRLASCASIVFPRSFHLFFLT